MKIYKMSFKNKQIQSRKMPTAPTCDAYSKKFMKSSNFDEKCLHTLIYKKALEDDTIKKNACVPCTKNIYTWSSAPRTLNNNVMKKCNKTLSGPNLIKDVTTQQGQNYKNLMHDKRIIRGSNYNQTHFASGDANFTCKDRESERRKCLVKNQQFQRRNLKNVIGTPPPVCGRKHEDVQTELYLEELYERPLIHEVSVQTDLYLQRPPTPPYVPSKIGVDVQTEILEGELFDFDTEVQPLLETLVGHTVEQSLLEVIHEEEISDLKKQQQEFLSEREAELAELRRLEAEELRLQAEKERRIRQDQISKELDEAMQERITAAKLLQGYIANILPGVLNSLEPLTEAADRENLEKELCPWLTNEVAQEVGHIIDSREILIEIIKEILVERASKYLNIPIIEEEEVEKDLEKLEEEMSHIEDETIKEENSIKEVSELKFDYIDIKEDVKNLVKHDDD